MGKRDRSRNIPKMERSKRLSMAKTKLGITGENPFETKRPTGSHNSAPRQRGAKSSFAEAAAGGPTNPAPGSTGGYQGKVSKTAKHDSNRINGRGSRSQHTNSRECSVVPVVTLILS
ncbi:hypothetical protein KIPB_009717 [Kipferlia bialata]|uniref:Uncharacterized protein n=1 Tax=Kipferlia bialata TaxID=797122 RepID=A0A9K3D288_9EUKA|nr:hypothetical protein KIPB_009717 [Kipferlia bialata]|eukprot:g9717.t1